MNEDAWAFDSGECAHCEWPEKNPVHKPVDKCPGCHAPKEHHPFEPRQEDAPGARQARLNQLDYR